MKAKRKKPFVVVRRLRAYTLLLVLISAAQGLECKRMKGYKVSSRLKYVSVHGGIPQYQRSIYPVVRLSFNQIFPAYLYCSCGRLYLGSVACSSQLCEMGRHNYKFSLRSRSTAVYAEIIVPVNYPARLCCTLSPTLSTGYCAWCMTRGLFVGVELIVCV